MSKRISRDERIDQAQLIHDNKYDYSHWPTTILLKTEVEIICPVHGIFKQTVKNHIVAKHGCRECHNETFGRNRKKTRKYFIDKASRVHNNKYDYSMWDSKIYTTDKVQIHCKSHGIFEQLLNRHLTGDGCPICKKDTISKSNKKPTQYFINKCNEIHNNKYDYSLWKQFVYTNNKVPIICPKHGKFEQLLNAHVNGQGCPTCGNVSCGYSKEKSKGFWIQLANQCHTINYNYSLWPTRIKSTDFVKIICPIHGIFTQMLSTHVYSMSNCPACSPKLRQKTNLIKYGHINYLNSTTGRRKIKQVLNSKYKVSHPSYISFPKQALDCLQDANWLRMRHHELRQTLEEIANEIRIHPTTVSNYCHKHDIEIKHYFQSTGEKQIGQFLKTLNVNFQMNSRTVIPPFELDIFIPDYKLAIEYNGLYWHSEQQGKHKWYHYTKWKQCNQQNIQLLTIFEDEWKHRPEQVKNKIRSLCNKNNQSHIFARNCKVINVSIKDKRHFFNENHIQGNGPSSINIGLTYNDEIVACVGIIKQQQHYLNRYATNAHVVGGFSKILNHFQSNFTWRQLVSFADLRWSTGKLYQVTGWTLNKILYPDYYYSIDGLQRVHKFNFRRKYLPTLLKDFNPQLSERENCDNNNILRIWDCGKYRFIINNS